MGQTYTLPYKQEMDRDFCGVRYRGTPKEKAESFYVKFYGSKNEQNFAANFEFCFQHSGLYRRTVCYIRKNFFYKDNVKEFDGFPFEFSTEFELTFLKKNDRKIQVFVNGSKYLTYDIGTSTSFLNAAEIGGDLEDVSAVEVL